MNRLAGSNPAPSALHGDGRLPVNPPFAMRAHAIRAILFASAIATSIRGFLAIMLASQDPAGAPPGGPPHDRHRTDDEQSPQVPLTILEMRPSRALPPEEFCRGVSPSQAAKSRPLAKVLGGGASASSAVA
jgi:hypothetical protein